MNMSDEFSLCWNSYSDNITTGLQSLLHRGELGDVSIACEGKILKAHRVVLSICSSYFQEMFLSMSENQHPVLILKDTSAKLMNNLLEFMYQGSVNVKQEDLQDFMKMAETLKIKGLTASSKQLIKKEREISKAYKRPRDSEEHQLSSHKTPKIHIDSTSEDDLLTNDEQFSVVHAPEVSLVEKRWTRSCDDSRETVDPHVPTCNLKIVESQSIQLNNFRSFDFPNDQSLQTEPQQYATDAHNDVPSGSSITMLSSTSLLHGNCIFNRNNTVATQAGLKTYWLCKSYRISMCKARCITHQGKVSSATGVHNHPPHMTSKPQDIPPGYTPNLLEAQMSSSKQTSTPHQQNNQNMSQSPYAPYAPLHMNQEMVNQSIQSIQDPNSSTGTINCKTEHN